VVKVQQKVTVTVLEVDLPRKRISLSMRSGTKPAKNGRTGPKTPRAPEAQGPIKSKGSKPSTQARQPFHNSLAEALNRLKRKY